MKNYNLEVVNQLNGILRKSESFELTENKRTLQDKIAEMRDSIEGADYLGASLDGFDAIKLMLKEKRKLIKEAASDDMVESMVALIQELRCIVKENDDVIVKLMQAESLAFNLKPILLISALVLLCILIIFQLR